MQSLSVDLKPILLAVDGKTVAYQLQDGTLGVWDLASNNQRSIATLSGMPDSALQVFSRIPGELAVSGNRLAVLSVKENYSKPFTVQVFDLDTNEVHRQPSPARTCRVASRQCARPPRRRAGRRPR